MSQQVSSCGDTAHSLSYDHTDVLIQAVANDQNSAYSM
jgi:hypothetical protein